MNTSFIGLLMVAEESDVLDATLARNEPNVDAFYVLSGSAQDDTTRAICAASPKCAGFFVDDDLPKPPYPEKPRDGYRQFLFERAIADHGLDNWFLLLHGDEVWTFDARELPGRHPQADGFIFRLPVYFPIAREGWDALQPPLDQLRWHLGPGWPEFRMFRGSPGVAFDPGQHFNVTPAGVRSVVRSGEVIKHYPFRSPAAQRSRAARHVVTGFDPDNYRHLIDSDDVLWTDKLVERWQRHSPAYAELRCDGPGER